MFLVTLNSDEEVPSKGSLPGITQATNTGYAVKTWDLYRLINLHGTPPPAIQDN